MKRFSGGVFYAIMSVLLLCALIYQSTSLQFEFPQAPYLQTLMVMVVLVLSGLRLARKMRHVAFFTRDDLLSIGAGALHIAGYYGIGLLAMVHDSPWRRDPIVRLLMDFVVTGVVVGPLLLSIVANHELLARFSRWMNGTE